MKRIPYIQCVVVISVLSISLIINIFVLNNPLYYGFIFGMAAAFIVGIINGYDAKALISYAYSGFKKSAKVLIMLSMIAMLIGLWKAGGIISAMLYYSFGLINRKFFLVSSFIISSIIGMIMGTSSGTVSTVGIVLIGLGSAMNIPLPVVAGTVVSAAFLADRSAPISSVFNLVATMTETDPHENFRYFMRTLLVGVVLSCIFYYFLGLRYTDMSYASVYFEDYKILLNQYVNITPWLLIPPIILFVLYAFKLASVYIMGISVFIGAVFSILYQKISVIEAIQAAIMGYHPDMPSEYSMVLAGGGLISFKNMLLVLIFATSLNGIFEGIRIVETLLEPILRRIRTQRGLMLFTIGFSIISALFMCNQVISIIIPTGLLLNRYKDKNIDRKIFARLLSDSGVMACSIIPWNVAALTPAAIMGVDVVSFMPYAFLSYVMPIIAVLNVMFFSNLNLREKRGRISEDTCCEVKSK
ncbi:Na+/H+ antiporter NhaC family protein [Lutispora thermophila]|uniref:Na+:H+ antiporter, NhaC family n=1 Tax=Lutispora thermophila DSM 19022 TaxID=1122184 RepID=A0A1M6CHT9_9FIRM|nr:Na+/H+ antiporter NhaC family protein [Lutispora thermophila]SHI60590.1 Na+:H+ antiporter, NhaC family [Lutispora thermophila DSM 19022]